MLNNNYRKFFGVKSKNNKIANKGRTPTEQRENFIIEKNNLPITQRGTRAKEKHTLEMMTERVRQRQLPQITTSFGEPVTERGRRLKEKLERDFNIGELPPVTERVKRKKKKKKKQVRLPPVQNLRDIPSRPSRGRNDEERQKILEEDKRRLWFLEQEQMFQERERKFIEQERQQKIKLIEQQKREERAREFRRQEEERKQKQDEIVRRIMEEDRRKEERREILRKAKREQLYFENPELRVKEKLEREFQYRKIQEEKLEQHKNNYYRTGDKWYLSEITLTINTLKNVDKEIKEIKKELIAIERKKYTGI
jgi:hypothetical protein